MNTTEKNMKIDKLDFISNQNLLSLKDITKKGNRHATDWEEIFAKSVSDKGLASRV